MVSNRNIEKPAIAYLKSLALLPGMEIRICTSSWSGGYLDNSRNLEIVLRNEQMAQRIAELHQQTWDSACAQTIDVMKDYPKPAKGQE